MRVTYLFDPLCGWCYGAGPALDRLALLDDVTLELMPTGVFAGEGARAMDAQFATYAWQNDQRIARLTGQPFSELYCAEVLGKSGGVFDSAPATLGVIAVRVTEAPRELDALKALQRARYVDGHDNVSLAGVSDILQSIGLGAAAERVRTQDDQLIQIIIGRSKPHKSRCGGSASPGSRRCWWVTARNGACCPAIFCSGASTFSSHSLTPPDPANSRRRASRLHAESSGRLIAVPATSIALSKTQWRPRCPHGEIS